jgi:cytochrome P450
LENSVQEIVDGLLDAMASRKPPVDLHEAFSSVLPAYLIGELLGIPRADRERFAGWAHALDNVYDAQASATAFMNLSEYAKGLVELKRSMPGEDAISDLIAAQEEWRLTPDDIVYLVVGLLFSGYAAPANTINFGTVLLLRHPDQKELIVRDPSLVPHAVEELIRFIPGGARFGLLRYAHADIHIGDVSIKAGDAVLLMNVVANRDPSIFDDPDRFDITRRRNPHLSMGHGAHYCLGAALGRLELQVVFRTLFQRFPDLRLAEPVEDLEVTTDQITERLVRVPVTW